MTKRTKKVKNYEGCLFQPGIQYFVCVLSENIEGNPSSLLALLPYPPTFIDIGHYWRKTGALYLLTFTICYSKNAAIETLCRVCK